MVNNQIRNESDPLLPPRQKPVLKKHKDPLEYLATRVSAKIEDAWRLQGCYKTSYISDDKVAPENATTFADLQQKNIQVYTSKL